MKKVTYVMKKWILGFMAGLTSLPAFANLYGVSDIHVDVEAENAVKAKETALSEAAVQAFPKLFSRLVFDDTITVFVQVPQSLDEGENNEMPMPSLPENENAIIVTPQQVSSFVEGVSVADEKNTGTRYMADVSVKFKASAVRDFFDENVLPFLDKEPPKMAVVPIFRENGTIQIFDEMNPLFQVLKNNAAFEGIHQFVVPLGDGTDQTMTEAIKYGGEILSFDPLMTRYHTPAVVILDVTKSGAVYTVNTKVYPANASAGSEVSFAVSSGSANVAAVLKQVVKKTFEHMDRKFKAYQAYRTSARSGVTALFEVNTLGEWTVLEKKLEAFEFVEQVDVRAIHKNQIYAELLFSENTPSALNKMTTSGIVLIPNGSVYVQQKLPAY